MAFNPKDAPKIDRVPVPIIGRGGKPAIVMTPLMLIEQRVKEELRFKPLAPLKPVSELEITNLPKDDYLIEWWEIGTPPEAIITAEFSCRHIKAFVKTFLSGGKYTLIYLERKSDGKVIWNRRSR